MRYLLLLISIIVHSSGLAGTTYDTYIDHDREVLTSEKSAEEGGSVVVFRYQGQYEDEETGLFYNRFRYYSAEEGVYLSQDPIRLAGSDNLYSYVHDSNSWIDPNGLMGFGSGNGTHTATVNVFDNNGNLVSSEVFQSGNMTAAEKALGFPQSTLATHTEARAVKKIQLQPGQTMEIIGQYPPCNSCKGKMNSTGSHIEYKWVDDDGILQTWKAKGCK